MIGGHDLIYEIEIEPELALLLVYEAAVRHWPDCIVEDSKRRKPLLREVLSSQLSGVSEIMIFKNKAFRELWRARGATSDTEDTMVYALAGDRELTLAICNPNQGEVKEIVSAVRQLINDPVATHKNHANE